MAHRLTALVITLLLSPLVASLAGAAQPSAPVPRIGLLCLFSPAIGAPMAEGSVANFRVETM